ncbi:MAG: phosphoribosylaminoimidazolesuccinocarboxamide synthase [Clostridiales bacterium]|jgi:phosphoribosylaminoimidazole-succinocarboxamide synthase|nr:phosphoribosylaminoimidazolesuccinocarboxamide synthase [Clostridiales bacterium]
MAIGTLLYEGKSKQVYDYDKDTCVIRFKNTATAGNGEKKEEFEDKGKLNAAISNLIYHYLEANGIKTHLVEVLDETSVRAKKVEVLMVEVIVRNLAAGSFSKRYGVAEGTKLKNTTTEFSLKSDALGDPLIADSHITAIGIATKAELKYLTAQALKINKLLQKFFKEAGIRLVDFKLEFGRCADGIVLCDEISPDSCRLWDWKTNEKLDKDRFRRDLGGVMEHYKDVLRRIQGVK